MNVSTNDLKLVKPTLNKSSFRPGTIGANICCFHGRTKEQEKDQFLVGKFIIIGVPDDRGVIANGGNPGAKEGPLFFRNSFYKLYDTEIRKFNMVTHYPEINPDDKTHNIFLAEKFVDAGNIQLEDTIEATHENLAQAVTYFLERGVSLICVIGGGHDFSYGSYKGHAILRKNEVVPVVNFDAHFDLRPVENGRINSGTAFYRIIQDMPKNIAKGRGLLEIGIQRERNPHSLYQFAFKHGVTTVEHYPLLKAWHDLNKGHIQAPLEHVRDHIDSCTELGFDKNTGSIHLSLCLDVFDQSIAPGTSASTPFGTSIQDIAAPISYFARLQSCRVFDIAELCPARDSFDQTSRLAAALVYRFALIRSEYAVKE